jgi:hypothetical protein
VVLKTSASEKAFPPLPVKVESVIVRVGAERVVKFPAEYAISPLVFLRPTLPLRDPDGTVKIIVIELTTVKDVTRTFPIAMSDVPVSAPPLNVTVSPARPVDTESELITGFVAVSTTCSTRPEVVLSNLRNPTSIVEPITAW